MRHLAFQWIFALLLFLDVTVTGQDASACCHVVEFEADASGGTWDFSAAMSSLYEQQTGLSKYCDFFEIRTVPADGSNYTVLGKRIFGHDHPYEQPFTRAIRDVTLPNGITTVMAIAHDSVDGYCGRTLELTLSANTPTSISAAPTAPSTFITAAPTTSVTVVSSPAPISSSTTPSTMVKPSTAPVLPTFPTLQPDGPTAPVAPITPAPITFNANSILPSSFPSSIPSAAPSSIPSDGPSAQPRVKAPSSTAFSWGLGYAFTMAMMTTSLYALL